MKSHMSADIANRLYEYVQKRELPSWGEIQEAADLITRLRRAAPEWQERDSSAAGAAPLPSIADRWWDGQIAQEQIEDALCEAGVEFDRAGTDPYDSSLELYDAPPGQRLSAEQQKIIFGAGFMKVYVNHTDKWETHYGAHKWPSDGWRVSYPHKRGDGTRPILVEAHVPSWPQEWFDTGYVVIREQAAAVAGEEPVLAGNPAKEPLS